MLRKYVEETPRWNILNNISMVNISIKKKIQWNISKKYLDEIRRGKISKK